MTVVWKFPLNLEPGPQKWTMPVGATIVHVQAQDERPTMWATVDPGQRRECRTFHVFATGQEVALPFHRYVGTVHVGWTVWHIFEDPSG